MREFVSQSAIDAIMKRSTEGLEHGALGAHHISVNNQPRPRSTLHAPPSTILYRSTLHAPDAPRFFSPRKTAFPSRKHLQGFAELLIICQHMSVSLCTKNIAVCLAATFLAVAAFGQGGSYA